MKLTKMVRALVLAAVASALVYAVMIFLSDGAAVRAALVAFPVGTLLIMLALASGCYLVRSVRWGGLMKVSGHRVSLADALYLHLAGQTMTISPGRVGELLKPWLSREIAGLPMSRGIALVFAERVADLIAVTLLSLGGLSALGAGSGWVLAGLGLIVAGTAVASSAWFHRIALRFIARQEWAKKHHASAEAISETVRIALGWKTMWWSVSASVLAWGLEGLAFAICLEALGFSALQTLEAVSVYAVATIIGAFTFMPGGIGITEASMAGILIALGMSASAASVATLITRVVTLWWAVALGWLVLLVRPSLLRRLIGPSSADSEALEA